jgi:hypothetical protein
MSSWRFKLYDGRRDFSYGELTDLIDRKLSLYLNRPPQFSASIPLISEQAARDVLTPGRSELVIVDPNGDELTDGALVLTSANIVLTPDGGMLNLTWDGIGTYWADALILPGSSYTGSVGAIAWAVANQYQARNVASFPRISQGVTASHGSTTVNYDDPVDVLSSIIDLSESLGFDWHIDADRNLNTYAKRGTDNGLVLEWGTHLLQASWTEEAGAGQLCNSVTVTGAAPNLQESEDAPDTYVEPSWDGTGQPPAPPPEPTPTSEAPDPGDPAVSVGVETSISFYGRREAWVSMPDVSEIARLTGHAAAIIKERSVPRSVPELVIDTGHPDLAWGAYALGDNVEVRLRAADYATLVRRDRIVAIHVDIRDDGGTEVRVEVNRA